MGGGRTTGDGSAAGGSRSHLRGLTGLMAVTSWTVVGHQEGGWQDQGGGGSDELEFKSAKI